MDELVSHGSLLADGGRAGVDLPLWGDRRAQTPRFTAPDFRPRKLIPAGLEPTTSRTTRLYQLNYGTVCLPSSRSHDSRLDRRSASVGIGDRRHDPACDGPRVGIRAGGGHEVSEGHESNSRRQNAKHPERQKFAHGHPTRLADHIPRPETACANVLAVQSVRHLAQQVLCSRLVFVIVVTETTSHASCGVSQFRIVHGSLPMNSPSHTAHSPSPAAISRLGSSRIAARMARKMCMIFVCV